MLKNRERERVKGFTLVELMIVIAIIGILSVVLYPQMTGYFERARDTKKRQDVRILINSLLQFQIDNATYRVPGTLSGTGWINAWGWPDWKNRSISQGLEELGYLKPGVIEVFQTQGPQKGKNKYWRINNPNNVPCATQRTDDLSQDFVGRDFYVLQFDDNTGTFGVGAYLERGTIKEKEDIQNLSQGMGKNGLCSKYGRNYGIGN